MEVEGDRYRQLTRRAIILGGGKVLLLSALVGRMYQLQIVESHEYQKLADENRIDLRLISPLRGRILDRFGAELATNRLNYRVSLISERATDVDGVLNQLAELIPLPSSSIARVLRDIKRARSFSPIQVAENLTWDEFARVNAHLADLPGVQPDAGQSRFYPNAQECALLLGYVGPVTEEELVRLPDDPVFLLPEFRIGKRGIEHTLDQQLRGTAGSRRVEVNALGREIRELKRDNGKPGSDLPLTIDLDIQKFAMERVGEQSAAVVVMDIHSGDVVSMVSAPGFDPNHFNFGISNENWRGLLNDPRKPLLNKPIQGQFPPGSTFKMIVAMAAIEEGIAEPDHTVWCPGHLNFGNRRFHCWKRGGHGWLDMVGSMEQSCDVYFYDLARKLGVDKIADMAHRFGFGEILGIEIDGEKKGVVPTRLWKRRMVGEEWQEGENLVVGIGQGFMSSTPLQLAVMAARIANGGYAVKPTLLHDGRTNGPLMAADRFEPVGVSPEALQMAQGGMIAVMEGTRGTARGAKIKDWPRGIAGKTGTAQVRRISKAERATRVLKNEERPWKERDHSLFVAYGPIDNPAYAISVIVEHGGGGSKVAAPIASDILREVLLKDPCGLGVDVPEALLPQPESTEPEESVT